MSSETSPFADDAPQSRWSRNAFFVLGASPDATPADLERAAQKLLAQLAIGATSAKIYATPFGPKERTPDLVREAIACLRAPNKRLLQELWARVDAADAEPSTTASSGNAIDCPDALAVVGFSAR